MTRAKLEELTQEFIDKAMAITKRAMDASPFKVGDLNEVILVGGQTRMPAMQKTVKEFFGKEPHLGVNPDEVVAVGAAIQGGILGGDVKDVLLLDVTPLSLGIETMGGIATKLIEKNTTIPTQRSQVFSTAADNQTSVEINISQGERAMSADNKSLGRFILDGIAPAPRGMPQIEVIFDLDANGILNVTAKDKSTGKANSIKITASSGLSKEEVEKMKKEADAHNADDQKKRDEVEMKNAAEQLVYASEKSLKDAGGKVPADLKKSIEDKVAAVKTAKGPVGSTAPVDTAALKTAMDTLSSELSKIGEVLSKAQQDAAAAGGAAGAGAQGGHAGDQSKGPEADVKDAEFKEKK
jgi:molecular chaperone DnaK